MIGFLRIKVKALTFQQDFSIETMRTPSPELLHAA